MLFQAFRSNLRLMSSAYLHLMGSLHDVGAPSSDVLWKFTTAQAGEARAGRKKTWKEKKERTKKKKANFCREGKIGSHEEDNKNRQRKTFRRFSFRLREKVFRSLLGGK